MRWLTRLVVVALVFCTLNVSCNKRSADTPTVVTVFLAAVFSQAWNVLRQDAEQQLKIELHGEISGSQEVCRKVTELGRECDLMLVADNQLFKEIASSYTTFRIDFAHDEIVLGVGIRQNELMKRKRIGFRFSSIKMFAWVGRTKI